VGVGVVLGGGGGWVCLQATGKFSKKGGEGEANDRGKTLANGKFLLRGKFLVGRRNDPKGGKRLSAN